MEEKLKEILGKSQNAYQLTEMIPSSGKSLDCMAAVRQELRDINQNVAHLLKELRKDGTNGG